MFLLFLSVLIIFYLSKTGSNQQKRLFVTNFKNVAGTKGLHSKALFFANFGRCFVLFLDKLLQQLALQTIGKKYLWVKIS